MEIPKNNAVHPFIIVSNINGNGVSLYRARLPIEENHTNSKLQLCSAIP